MCQRPTELWARTAEKRVRVQRRRPQHALLLLLLLLLLAALHLRAVREPGLPDEAPAVVAPGAARLDGWEAALAMLRASSTKYVVVFARNGLGNRLRALASSMSVAASLGRPVLLIWESDLHCNCSYPRLFADPLPFALLEEEIPPANLSDSEFQLVNYMRPEPGAVKDAPVDVDVDRHLYFKSGFVMNHPAGAWKYAQRHIQRLTPVDRVVSMLQANKNMVGLHVRNVFDAPRDAKTYTNATGDAAVEGARKEYGAEGTAQLLMWRNASHWTNFVARMEGELREAYESRVDLLRTQREPSPLPSAAALAPRSDGHDPLLFYLAADSAESYDGLRVRFPGRIRYTQRECASGRCDDRDCEGQIYSLVDMLNLGRTKLILGSGWSSYSEVAAYIGGAQGQPVPILMAGRDFGEVVRGDDVGDFGRIKESEERKVYGHGAFAVGGGAFAPPRQKCCQALITHGLSVVDGDDEIVGDGDGAAAVETGADAAVEGRAAAAAAYDDALTYAAAAEGDGVLLLGAPEGGAAVAKAEGEAASPPRVTVVVTTSGVPATRYAFLQLMLRTYLSRAYLPLVAKVVVVWSSLGYVPDELQQLHAAAGGRLAFVQSAEGGGGAAAAAAGGGASRELPSRWVDALAHVSTEFVLALDDDALLLRDGLSCLLATARLRPADEMLGPYARTVAVDADGGVVLDPDELEGDGVELPPYAMLQPRLLLMRRAHLARFAAAAASSATVREAARGGADDLVLSLANAAVHRVLPPKSSVVELPRLCRKKGTPTELWGGAAYRPSPERDAALEALRLELGGLRYFTAATTCDAEAPSEPRPVRGNETAALLDDMGECRGLCEHQAEPEQLRALRPLARVTAAPAANPQALEVEDVDDEVAPSSVVASSSCPTREDVLNTPARGRMRWSVWDDTPFTTVVGGLGTRRQLVKGDAQRLGRAAGRAKCADDCAFRWCANGTRAPCCVRRLRATWPVPCFALPGGCHDPNDPATALGAVVVDLRVAPTSLVADATCPSREDVMNTPSAVRWRLWDDGPSCAGGCELTKCNPRVSPCCVRRARPLWPVRCEHLKYGCAGSNKDLEKWGLFVRDKRAWAAAKAAAAVAAVALAALTALRLKRRGPLLRCGPEGALARVEWKRRAREGSPPQVWTRFARGGVLDKA